MTKPHAPIVLFAIVVLAVASCRRGDEKSATENSSDTPRGQGSGPSAISSRYAELKGVAINPANVPEALRPLIPYAKEWAIGDDVERSGYMASVSFELKEDFVTMVWPHMDAIESFCSKHRNETPVPDEVVLFDMMAKAAAEVRYAIANRLWMTSRYKGHILESCVTGKQFDGIPPWDPMASEAVPLAPEKAILLARSVLEEHVPKPERENWILKEVGLRHFSEVWPPTAYADAGKQKWYYVVLFWNKNNPEVAAFPTPPEVRAKQDEFNIIVLTNGEVCKAVPREASDKESQHREEGEETNPAP